MIKGTPELIAQRREEIVNACEGLYQTMSFKDITLKEIGSATSFSRPTIYNYFQTKEEIFLALFQREYELWSEALEGILRRPGMLSRRQLADRIAETLSERELMLKLLAVNQDDMEENSRMESLVEFKKAYGKSVDLMEKILAKYCPGVNEAERHSRVISSLQFLHGIYPYAYRTKKQEEAMKKAGVMPVRKTIRELAQAGLRRLLA